VNDGNRITRLLLVATRVWLPLAIAAAGVVLIVIGHGRSRSSGATALGNSVAAAGVALLIAAIIVWMLNWMYRMSVQSNRERDQEEAARDYFELHGRWPDEDGS
jgi:membrane protein implicated in regulation of membrane protease activity